MNHDTVTSTSDREATLRQQIGATARELLNQAQRQQEKNIALFAAAKALFEKADKEQCYGSSPYKNEINECSLYLQMERERRRMDEEGDIIRFESDSYINFLAEIAWKSLPKEERNWDMIGENYICYCQGKAEMMEAELAAGRITGDAAVRARKFIRFHLGKSSTLN